MMSRTNKILMSIGLSIWVALYSLWNYLDQPFLYYLGQSIVMVPTSIVMVREFKGSLICLIFLVLTTNQLIDEILLWRSELRMSEYISVAIAIIYLIQKKLLNTKTTNGTNIL